MPIQYGDSIMDATKHCRSQASLFDVSHMCGLTLEGKDAVAFLETLVVGDVRGIPVGSGSLSVFTNERGGIIDDTVVTRSGEDSVYLVVNAGCRDKDLKHLNKHLTAFRAKGGDVSMTVHDDRSLLALQGPKAAEVLSSLAPQVDLSKMFFSNFARTDVNGSPCFVTRTGELLFFVEILILERSLPLLPTRLPPPPFPVAFLPLHAFKKKTQKTIAGYTGEDGFEISVPNGDAVSLARALLSGGGTKDASAVRLCGLGARDSLRLEAGLCLYGNDLNEDITPVEAGLTWTIGKRRRDACDFLGGEVIKRQLADGVSIRRVGLVAGGAPPRQHADILLPDGETRVGEVSSGAFSPCLGKNVAMGYVPKEHAKAGTQLKVSVRGKLADATVTKMPFVANNYYKG